MAFRTITEVAADLQVPQHVLRFWETKFPQVKPLKRGGGRRYYRPEDVATLEQIRQLLYADGYTIRGAQKLLRGRHRGRTARDRDDLAADRSPGDGSAPPGETSVAAPVTAPAPAAEPSDPREAKRWRELRDVLAELEAIRRLLP